MEAQPMYMVRLNDGQEFGPAPMDMITEWAKQRRIPVDALLVAHDSGQVRSVLSEPALRAVLQSPPMMQTGPVVQGGGDSTASIIIPTRNPCALIGYYVAVFSFLIWPLAPVALVLGILGWRRRIRQPDAHGLAHAIFATIVGTLFTALGLLILGIIIANAA